MIRLNTFLEPRAPSFDSGLGRSYENRVPVGLPRARADINTDRASNQLVQFFLRTFFRARPELLPKPPPGRTGFLLDGIVGNQTIEGIARFQTNRKKAGFHIFTDGVVSVATGDFVPETNVFWTIHLLNIFARNELGDKEFDHLFLNKEIEAEALELFTELVFAEQKLVVDIGI